jgi:molecular chaperone GrpE
MQDNNHDNSNSINEDNVVDLKIDINEEPSLENELENLEKQLAEMKDNWLRAMAESENLRRRAHKEKEDALKYGAVNFGRDVVSVADNLHRALESCVVTEELPANIKALISGVEMTAKELLSAFEKHGIKRLSPMGEKFDPNFHQAMFEIETNEQASGTVMQVLQDGYIMHDRLLRPAMVGVAKNVAASESSVKVDTVV